MKGRWLMCAALLCHLPFATKTAGTGPAGTAGTGPAGTAGTGPAATTAQHEHHHPAPQAAPAGAPSAEAPAGPVTTLAELEALAQANHPALAAAAAAEQAGEGARRQAGLWPNPTVGVAGEDIPLESGRDDDAARYGFFLGQEIVTAGKAAKGREVAATRLTELAARSAAARLAVLTTLRVEYARSAAAQRLLAVRARLTDLGAEAVAISRQLYNTGAADGPDVAAAEIEVELAALAEERAQAELLAALQRLAATAGEPGREIARVADDLEASLPAVEEAEARERLLTSSPELAGAQARVTVAASALARAKALGVPNLEVTAGALHDRERISPAGPRLGWEGFFKLGVPLPLFDRNQGGIAQAEADLARVRAELAALEGELAARFAGAWAEYSTARQAVDTYRTGILPKAEQAYRAYLERYQAMMAAYPQVLIAQRTWSQAEADYVAALGRLHEVAARIEGLLVPADDPSPPIGGAPAGARELD